MLKMSVAFIYEGFFFIGRPVDFCPGLFLIELLKLQITTRYSSILKGDAHVQSVTRLILYIKRYITDSLTR